MTKTIRYRGLLRYLLPISFLVFYVLLSTGLVDAFLTRNRQHVLNEIEVASSSNPPDIASLCRILRGPDWFLAAVTAERIGILWQSDRLESEQADIALRSLFDALASNGHWWRFGWDREDPEFHQFRSAAIEATGKFGPTALPMLLRATSSPHPLEREAACWIVFTMIEDGWVDHTTLAEAGILDGIRDLAKNDSESAVRESCLSVVTSIESAAMTDELPSSSDSPDSK
jgi:hypothetical protein